MDTLTGDYFLVFLLLPYGERDYRSSHPPRFLFKPLYLAVYNQEPSSARRLDGAAGPQCKGEDESVHIWWYMTLQIIHGAGGSLHLRRKQSMITRVAVRTRARYVYLRYRARY